MIPGKMSRRFWSYTAGKGDLGAEERQAAWEKRLQAMQEHLPGLCAFGLILLVTLFMLLMMLAEFRGFYIIEQFAEIFRVR